jgi:Kef-type K+ transport system membrane component KefB
MSGSSKKRTFGTRIIQAVALLIVFLLPYAAAKASPSLDSGLGVLAAVGFLLLAGTLMSELLETIGLPHLSGYLLAGILAGPHVFHLLDHDVVEKLSPVNTLALALIALAGGAELRLTTLRSVARSVSIALLLQSSIGFVVITGIFLLVAPMIPFASELAMAPLFGVAILWGVIGVCRSPSACLGILSQTRAKGPLASFSLAFIMASDVVVVLLMACALMIARPLVTPGGSISPEALNVLGHEILGSIAMGTTLGLLLILYLKLVEHNLLLVLLVLGFGMTEFMRYVHIDPLLSFMTAGFVVMNLSAQGEKLLHSVENTGAVVFVVFFATAGAHLDVPLLRQMWPVALLLCGSRAIITVLIAIVSSRWAKDPPMLRRWGFSSLVSQAGLTLGLGVVVARAFPEFGEAFRNLVIATVAINECVGPILFKIALDRAGETSVEAPSVRPSLMPAAPPH